MPLQLTHEQEDALREVSNIMVGHAATALARLSDTRIDISIPRIQLLDWREGMDIATEGSKLIAGVRTRMLGALSGDVYVTFPRDSALSLTDIVRGEPPGTTRYMSASAATTLVEIGNILAGSCLAAFYDLLDISLVHSVPEFVYDAPGVLLQTSHLEGRDGNVIVAQVTFEAPDINLAGHLILLFTMESLTSLLRTLESGQ
ncbi:MAG TPA: chemotaxis protein CheC [Candidatus Thermoplasmatota archaeon]|nr:chemotaxis protein CheC [Candidatus Thermoplasmatota archaeon]